ncbi:MAG: beta-CASP ribonuclease aCPSF1 [Candidatus Altiarchaeota archaeon]|nr:beta-CASP ribonuclease aCPSF1 [Candidatus Altiarchaeota archaeon]
MSGKEILDRVLDSLPSNANISEARFEGASAVVFTKDIGFLMRAPEVLREVAKEMKLRVEARVDRSLLITPEEAEETIKKIATPEANISSVFFDAYGSRVIIEAERPGLVIGKSSENLDSIKKLVGWTPVIQRTPPLKSDIINTIRKIRSENSKERADFLHKVGMSIYEQGKEPKWIRLSHLGAAREVGRSALLAQTPQSRVLLDCGVNVASKEEEFPYLDAPEFSIPDLDAITISHAHLDHSGALPYIYKYGYKGPVYTTAPTLPLMVLLQLDYMQIAEREGGKSPYSSNEIKEVVLHTITLPFQEVTNITPDVRLTLFNSGHMIGASQAHLHIGEGFYNLVYSADLKYGSSRLQDPAQNKFPRAECVIIESTYGNEGDIQSPRRESEQQMIDALNTTIDNGGKTLIPVLGVGRAQEIMLILQEHIRNGNIKPVPVYIDGIVWDTTAIYTTFPEFLNHKIRNSVFANQENPLLDEIFQRVGGQKDRERISMEAGPAIILATSGMMTGGPSVFYFSKIAHDPKSSIMFVNYQAEGSLGRRIQKGVKEASVYEGRKRVMVKINLQHFTIDGLSAHSDRPQLMSYLSKMEPRPSFVIVQHGEYHKCINLARGIKRQLRIESVAPKNLDCLRLR